MLHNNLINLKLFEFEFNINELHNFKDVISTVISIIKEKFQFNLRFVQPILKKVLAENKLKMNENQNKKLSSVPQDNHLAINKKSSIQGGLNSVLQNNILNEIANSREKPSIPKFEDNESCTASNNTSYIDAMKMPSITDIKGKELKNISSNNKNGNVFSESDIEKADKTFENISDLEDYGITIEKNKKNIENIKKIQSFTRFDSEKTEESQNMKKNAEITSSNNGALKLTLKNTGNINSMNIHIK
jgi:hypothetical protein